MWRRPPIWLLAAIVALLGWRVGMNPPTAGLDASWNAGLTMAVRDGFQFGREIVFSYGPLGFLQGQLLWYGDLGLLAFLYSAVLYLGFCAALVWALRRVLQPLPAVLVAFVVVVLPLLEQPLLLAVLVGMGMLAARRSERSVYVLAAGGASLAAVEALVKLSTGPLVVIVFLLALIGLRARWWQVAGFLALFAIELLFLWLAAGQDLSGIPDFVAHSWQIASGYSAAMSRKTDVAPWKVVAATLIAASLTLALIAAAARARYRDERARWAAVALMALAAFATFKQGIVRTDAGHLSLYFSTACVLWISIPWAAWRWMLAGAVTIALIGVPVRPPGAPTNLDPIANLRFAADQVRTLAGASRRADLIAAGRAGMKAVYRLDRPTRAALQNRSVAIEPWETGIAWAYDLDWSPLPVFQNYLAYSSPLDELNATAAAGPGGPERILRENPTLVDPEFPTRGIDNRYPGWDPPAQARSVLCHFVPLHTTHRWQVLGRTANRCSPPRPAGSVAAGSGEAVPVPAAGPGEVIFASIDGVGVGGLESVLALLLRARIRHAVLDGDRSYRLIPETARDGLLLRGDRRAGGSGAFAQIPQARTIAVTGAGDDLRFHFFRMRVRDPGRAPGGG